MANRLGGELARRPLHVIFVCDVSGSMAGSRIASLNTAVHEALPELVREAANNPEARVAIRVLAFSTGAHWQAADPTDVESFRWRDLTAGGVTDMGRAFVMLADELGAAKMDRGLPPVLILISDGQPTDKVDAGLDALLAQPWGKKSVRVAISIGGATDAGVLEKFTGNPELVLQADNSAQLVQFIRWASTVPVKAASNPASVAADAAKASGNITLPPPPPPLDPASVNVGDVF